MAGTPGSRNAARHARERVLADTPAQGVLVIAHITAALDHFDRVLELADGRLTQIAHAAVTTNSKGATS